MKNILTLSLITIAALGDILMDHKYKPASCDDVMKYDNSSGIHTLFLPDYNSVEVYCNQWFDNGGWTVHEHVFVIQRRKEGSPVDFYRNWEAYRIGFGYLNFEFWIGLDNLYLITKGKDYKLHIDFMDFDGNSDYAVYHQFHMHGPEDFYRLSVSGFEGTAGDSLSYDNGRRFSTYDKDNDEDPANCAQIRRAGWWFGKCIYGNLNGPWNDATWYDGKSALRYLQTVDMKIKLN